MNSKKIYYVPELPTYDEKAFMVPNFPEKTIELPLVYDGVLRLGVWNNGWICQGSKSLIIGCTKGYN